MKKNTIILTNCLSAFLILTQFDTWNALVMFLLVGQIPGTNMSVSPLLMLLLICLAITVCTVALIMNADADLPIKKSLPKKRYSRI